MDTDVDYTLKIETLNDLIEALHKIFDHDVVNIEHVKAVLTAYRSNPKDWKKFAKFDRNRYTRNLIDVGNGKFNLMALCWSEGQGSSIHDHSDAHCFVKVLDGTLSETMFAWPSESDASNEMRVTREADYEKNGVAYINDSMGLHRMENKSHTDTTVTLHLYSPPFSSCHAFDQRTGHKHKCQVTFWSKFGERTPFTVDKCTAPSDPTSCSMAENN